MESSIKFDTVKSGWSIVYIEGSQAIISMKKSISNAYDIHPHSKSVLKSYDSIQRPLVLKTRFQ